MYACFFSGSKWCFFFFITVPPRIHHVSSGGHRQVKKGESVRIECSASGNILIFICLFLTLWVDDLSNLILIGFVFFIFLIIQIGNPSPNITWTRKFENLPNGKYNHTKKNATGLHFYLNLMNFSELIEKHRISAKIIFFLVLVFRTKDFPRIFKQPLYQMLQT